MKRKRAVPPGWKLDGKGGVVITADKGVEFFVGGLCSCLMLADRLGLKASVGGALVSALSMALPDLPLKGVVAAYHKIGGELPPEVGAKVLAATKIKKRRRGLPRRVSRENVPRDAKARSLS